MKVIEALQGDEQIISLEIEPPSLGRNLSEVFDLLDPLVELGVRYVDITYHAEQIVSYVADSDGHTFPVSQRKKPGTAGVAGAIRERYKGYGIEPVPHVICTGFTPYNTEEYLVELAFLGIQNVVALRGDAPKGPDGQSLPFTPAPGGYRYAEGLIRQIANLKQGLYVGAQEGHPIDFCIGAACYPEGYAPSVAWDDELRWLHAKIEAGADYLITQMFFDNAAYWRFVDRARQAGIEVPIVPGIKPLSTYRHLSVLPAIFGCTIPSALRQNVERYRDNRDDLRKVGVQWCLAQCADLRAGGAPSLHFYAARRAPIRDVLKQL